MRPTPPRRTRLVVLVLPLVLAGACRDLVLPVGRDAPPPKVDASVHDASLRDASPPEAAVREASLRDASLLDAAVLDASPLEAGSPLLRQQSSCLQASGWTWCNPLPTGVSLDAVWGSAASDVWAVGAGGIAEHWNGMAWSVVPTPTTLELFSVWGTSATNAWAVGSNAYGTAAESATSVILHWDGTSWSTAQTLAATELWSVWGSGANDVWAVGASDPGAGLFVHWNGTTWTSTASSAASVLYGVWGSNATDVWAVGNLDVRPDGSSAENDGTFVPEILRWNGLGWSIAYNNGGGAVMSSAQASVWGTSPSDVWVATGAAPLHWNGAGWAAVAWSQATGPTAFGGTATGDVWGTVGTQMEHWNDSAWMPSTVAGIASPGTTPVTLESVWASSSSDVWAVGEGGALAHFDGSAWSTVSPMPNLDAAWAISANDAWAVGSAGSALHWDGAAWSTTSTGTTDTLTAVWAASASDVWTLASTSTVRRWNGNGWGPSGAPTSDPLAAIGGTGSSDVWISNGPNSGGDAGPLGAPTNTGEIFHSSDAGWTSTPVPVSNGATGWIQAIWALAADDVWAAGYQSETTGFPATHAIVAHWNGSAWSLSQTPLTTGATIATAYTSLWASSATDVWVAGTASGSSTVAVLHWDGVTWHDVTPTSLSGVAAVWGSSANDVWLWTHSTGVPGEALMHWTGSAWSTSLTLPDAWSYGNALTGTGPGDLWGVGSGGMILHHS